MFTSHGFRLYNIETFFSTHPNALSYCSAVTQQNFWWSDVRKITYCNNIRKYFFSNFFTLFYYGFINLLLKTNYSSFIWWCPRSIKWYIPFLSASDCMMVGLHFLYQVVHSTVFCLIKQSTCNVIIYKLNYLTVLIFINVQSIFYMNWGMHMLSSSIWNSLWSSKFKIWPIWCNPLKTTLPHNCLNT